MDKKIKPVLCVVTSNNVKGSTGIQTGFWLSELIHPVDQFEKAGISYEIVSIKGGEPPVDQMSMDLKDEINAKFMNDEAFMKKLKNTRSIDQIKASDYSAVFFAGGHGPMWDFPNNQFIHQIVRQLYENGDIVSAVCHGPCALVNVQLSNEDYLIKGKKMTSFTNGEEVESQSTEIVPFSLQTCISNHHALYQETPNWSDNVIVDGHLVTGQNPYSAATLGATIAKMLIEKNR